MVNDLRQHLERSGQQHLLDFAHELSAEEQSKLRRQIEALDFEHLRKLHAHASDPPATIDPSQIEPMEALAIAGNDEDREVRARCAATGLEAMLAGRLAVVLVAGGQGSRLGFEHPKGMFPIGPVTGASLFQIHAEKVLARSKQSGSAIPWYIMTSPGNDAETKAFFAEHRNFGLANDQVKFFVQGTMPAVDIETGRVLLADKGEIFQSPNGHGGTLLAMRDEGVLDDMKRRGCDTVFYFQVDNPFIDVLDPTFIGYHLSRRADVSMKVIRKKHPAEKVGLVVRYQGRPVVIEYSDLPTEIGERTDDDGNLLYWTGSIAIHLFSRPFLERITGDADGLPFHIAKKKVPFLDPSGQAVQPESPNAIKFETFVFDSLPYAETVAVVETDRTEEYEPVKNAEGEHSPAVVRSAIARKSARWLTKAGISFPTDAAGEPAVPIEISPLAGLTAHEFERRVQERDPVTGPTAWTDKGRRTQED